MAIARKTNKNRMRNTTHDTPILMRNFNILTGSDEATPLPYQANHRPRACRPR